MDWMKNYSIPCNAGRETINIHNNGDSICHYAMCIGDWAEVGFTADELRFFVLQLTELLPNL